MTLDILLLLALPASGKSELRRYIASLDPVAARDDLNFGPTTQLDDYPYVHMMRRIAAEVAAAGEPPVFFSSPDEPFLDSGDWGTLTQLLNLDFADLRDPPEAPTVGGASSWLLDRIDQAREEAGLEPLLGRLGAMTQKRLHSSLEAEARELFDKKRDAIPADLEEMTVVIEFARGGPEGSRMPLEAPYGYRYSLAQLDDDILERASILYVWVEPEESRRKNVERATPGAEGDASILHHGVPEAVMRREYGTDDLMWLLAEGGGSVVYVEKNERHFALPTGVFDNREDLTSFLRAPEEEWSPFKLRQLHRELVNATAGLRT
ncbi:MAG: hypothetical protein QNJ77_06765 [Acidimicrobiia bacterium]|nr:hypothetical protein [Acidimicrobiia bacterium]